MQTIKQITNGCRSLFRLLNAYNKSIDEKEIELGSFCLSHWLIAQVILAFYIVT